MGHPSRQTATVIHMQPPNQQADQKRAQANEEWAACLKQVGQNQDRKAFATLFGHYAPQIKSYGLTTAGVPGLHAFADELVQETMIKVWRNAGRFDQQKAGATTWIFTIARNARIDLLRRNTRHKADVDADDLWLEAEYGAPHEEMEQRRNAVSIRDAIGKLPQEQAQAIGKVYLEGKSHSEVALELEVPLGTIKSRVRLALSKMKLMVNE
jgi:RNA polymerase sigma factor (sigma-70 family)